MSERRKKRTNKANNPEVRDVPERASEPTVPETVSQQASEALPQEDTETRQETQEVIMGYGFTDRIKELVGRIWRPIAVLAIVAALTMSIVVLTNTPSKAAYNADIARLEQGITAVGSNVADNTADITDLQGDIEAAQQQYGNITGVVSQHVLDINLLQNKVGAVENDITTLELGLAAVGSPPEGYLTGTFGNYTLHIKCDADGNYTANVNLVYGTPVGNATTQSEAADAFYVGINWTGTIPNYVCDASYSGNTSSWGITRVWFNIGVFPALAANETAVNIIFNLTGTWQPDFAYVEVFPVA